MEQDIPGLISNHHKAVFSEKSHKYSNIVDKIRNPKVGDQVAWNEFQPVLWYCVAGYPEIYRDLRDVLSEVFSIRRDAFRFPEKRDTASLEVRTILERVPAKQQNLLDAPNVCIRDLFNIDRPRGKSRI